MLTASRPMSLASRMVVAGLVIGSLKILDEFIYNYLVHQTQPDIVLKYTASGLQGTAAFTGGLASALLGLVINYGISIVAAGVFVVAASQIPALRRNLIAIGLLYGLAVLVVMHVVVDLSAAPGLNFSALDWANDVFSHAVLVGLPAAIVVSRSLGMTGSRAS